jgi:hypothetical protein
MIEIWAGGQTGVDLGAHLEALAMGAPIAGFMPADARNEDGPIPEHVALHLTRHDRSRPDARTRANVAGADAALVIVADRRRAGATRGTALTIRLCEEREKRGRFRLLVVDPEWRPRDIAWLIDGWPHSHIGRRMRLMVAGPRASLWPDGEETARRFVRAVLEAVDA